MLYQRCRGIGRGAAKITRTVFFHRWVMSTLLVLIAIFGESAPRLAAQGTPCRCLLVNFQKPTVEWKRIVLRQRT